jgi:glucokinase
MTEYVVGADVGGTKTLMALAAAEANGPRALRTARYENDAFPDFYALCRRFVADECADTRIARVCVGLAGPHEADTVRLTNRDWVIALARVAECFSGAAVRLANDFEVAAAGIDRLNAEDCLTLQAGEAVADAPQVVIGAGTGLGVAYRVWMDGRYRIIPGEGGHAGFAPLDERLAEIWHAIYTAEGRVGNEMLVSGAGIARIYAVLSGHSVEPAEVSRRAHAGEDEQARESLRIFARCYGAVAGDHALGVLARGGVFLVGGVTRKTLEFLRASDLLEAFNAKGAHTALMRRMPLHLVLNESIGLAGAVSIAARG